MSLPEQFSLSGRTAIVTGGGRGLGAAAAAALAEAGAIVVLAGRSESALAAVVEQIETSGGTALARVADVAQESEVEGLFDWIQSERGPVDVLVNNAAIADQAALSDVSVERWDAVIATNLRGVFLTSRALIRQSHPGQRTIINISSLAATAGVRNQAAYSASKGAVESLTRALAVELAPQHVRVNAIAPGYFNTDMPAEVLTHESAREALLRRVPQRRVPEPEEIGSTVVYLAAGASAFLTGNVIHLDGGYTAQ
ncbi:SDR family NAD(P)-dependent oxidoreductase [Microbacterium rhizomatis]|uniref:SDR family NAD(P)-dependent oxidoreductase n=1 Tax=Microbacterium rhizomatis TaxID=1631477 RepID=UPI00147939B9|nr:SDR family oxidoreductase [Microbacterium rhizomatis]